MNTEQTDQNKLSQAELEPEKAITKKELAKRLGVSIGTVDNMIKKRSIPFMKLGYVIRFMWSDVTKALFTGGQDGQ